MAHGLGDGVLQALLPSFGPFVAEGERPVDFELSVDEDLPCGLGADLVGTFDTGNGETTVHALEGGGYQYSIKDIRGRECCLLQSGKAFAKSRCRLSGTEAMRSFGLNNALMYIYAFGGSFHSALLIHASCVGNGGWAFPFIAKSGTGKSTHSGLWIKNIAGTELINDDNPIVRLIDGRPIVYGTPWSGKTPCYRNVAMPLGAITRIARAGENRMEKLPPTLAFASVLPSCSSMKWDGDVFGNICDAVAAIVESTPVYTLHCLPNDEAARLCYETIAKR